MFKRITKSILACSLTAVLMFGLVQPVIAKPDTRPRAAAFATNSNKFTPSEKYKYSTISNNIKKAQEINKEVKGWLIVPGTNINQPVTFSSKDNYRYLYRTWQGQNYTNITYKNYVDTAIYADYRVNFGETSWRGGSRNIALYGHNWTNLRAPLDIGSDNRHTMFGQLPSYTDIDFAKEHPYIYFSTDQYEGVWKVFSVAYCEVDVTKFPYNTPNPNKEQYETVISEWRERSLFDFDVEVDSTDRLLTLSTCTRYYNVGDQQRYVVTARLLREGESDQDPVKITVNKDQKKPQF